MIGRISFVLMKGHDKVHQMIEFPRFDIKGAPGREYFAKWTPSYHEIHQKYMTDANGFDIMSRDVYQKDSTDFSSSFYPVDASITVTDS